MAKGRVDSPRIRSEETKGGEEMFWILLVLVILLLVLYLKWRTATMSLIYFMKKKGYTQPSDEEMAECSQWVIKKVFTRK